MARTTLTLLIATALLAACRIGAGGQVEREVTGTVTAGPTCPVVTDPPDPSCADRPVADAVLVIEDATGQEVARLHSSADGSFQVLLIPGGYTLVPQPVEGLLGTAPPTELTVPVMGDVGPLAISYDTGIR